MFNAIKLNVVEVNFVTFIGLILYLASETPISTQIVKPTQQDIKKAEVELSATISLPQAIETTLPATRALLDKT